MTTWTWFRHRSTASPPLGGDTAAVLRSSPVLLLAGPPADVMVNRLLRTWNPRAQVGGGADGTLGSCAIADGVRWVGPFRLGAVGAAEAGLPLGWSTAYAAQAERRRMRVPDGLAAAEVRERYPDGIPVGAEAVAWSLVTGLARRLDGAARLPAGDRRPRNAGSVVAQRPELRQNTYCVYGNQALPWSVLCSLLALSLPGLDLNGALADNDYCLDRTDTFEVRVEPFREGDFLPYALRPRATEGWPCTVYRFRCLSRATRTGAAHADLQLRGAPHADLQLRADVQLRAAALELADVVGGALLDGEGFPVITELARQRR
ncbi:hypothetical protein KDK95_00460 [Actinospica sp. MGRD01-02]|uniref:Uncharacterized protein n=1 Tax=Actinospica acidithermotolerans TaxID=2828514 RepID=A0A941E5G4_9ACTN|nr:hypothetical protein [Actinospica acidithermotolerans]MBR7824762.1 hypothetical protein [Actinospica acidithermotolerans]